jgi:hypothetical protein
LDEQRARRSRALLVDGGGSGARADSTLDATTPPALSQSLTEASVSRLSADAPGGLPPRAQALYDEIVGDFLDR